MKGEAKSFYVLELSREELEVLTLAVGGTRQAALAELGVVKPELISEIFDCLTSIQKV